jgi:hypothetical protein
LKQKKEEKKEKEQNLQQFLISQNYESGSVHILKEASATDLFSLSLSLSLSLSRILPLLCV